MVSMYNNFFLIINLIIMSDLSLESFTHFLNFHCSEIYLVFIGNNIIFSRSYTSKWTSKMKIAPLITY